MELKMEFFNLLIENSAYAVFCKNFAKTRKITIDDFLDTHKPVLWIDQAFFFTSTKKGITFWSNLSLKWKMHLYNKRVEELS